MTGKVNLGEIGGIPVVFVGAGISFLGSLPVGTMNMAVLQTAVQHGLGTAVRFSLGAILVETLTVRALLGGAARFGGREKWFPVFRRLTVLLLLGLAAGSFWTAFQPFSAQAAPVFAGGAFFSGMAVRLVALNMVPFWAGCNTALMSKNILLPRQGQFNRYVLGIGLGSFLGHLAYGWGGSLAAGLFREHHFGLNFFIGAVLVGAALGSCGRVER